MKKRVVSMALVLCMLLAALPTAVFAADYTDYAFSGGNGTEAKPYKLSTAQDLANLAEAVSGGLTYEGKYLRLTQDISLSEVCGAEKGSWTPIGTSAYAFAGTFDGSEKTISNLYISETSDDQALFGAIGENGTVQDLMVSGEVTGQSNVAGLCVTNFGTIERCANKAVVTGDDSGNGVAGLCVTNHKTIQDCYNAGSVTNTSGAVAGVCAVNNSGAAVKYVHNVGGLFSSSTRCGIAYTNGGSIDKAYYVSELGGLEEESESFEEAPRLISRINYENDAVYEVNARLLSDDNIATAITNTGVYDGSGTSNVTGWPYIRSSYSFQSGQVAIELQDDREDTIWGQGLPGYAGNDPYPYLTSDNKYRVTFFSGGEGTIRNAVNRDLKLVTDPTSDPATVFNTYWYLDADVTIYTDLPTDAADLPAEVRKEGYALDGWYDNAELTGEPVTKVGMKWDSGGASAGEKTFYAKWTANTDTAYMVEHYKQALDGTYPEDLVETESMTGTTDTLTAASAKTYEGFTAGTIDQENIAGNGSTVVKIRYARNSYTLKYVFNDGETADRETLVKFEDTAEKPSIPSRMGYTFDGWYKDAACTTAWDFENDTVTADTTLYARWTAEDVPTDATPSGPLVPARPVAGACPRDETCPIWPFTDASTTAWYHDGVHYCLQTGLMEGYGNGKFGPNNTLTRAELAQILYNQAGKPAVTAESEFEDVQTGEWYYDAIVWATENQVVYGYGNGKFGPNDNITREQLAAMLCRRAGEPETAGDLSGFTDADQVSSYAVAAIQWAVEHGIVEGKGNGVLDPRGNATRAEAATMLTRYFTKVVTE